jgi:hypothetical protein
MTTNHIVLDGPLPPQQVVHNACDFSDRRE